MIQFDVSADIGCIAIENDGVRFFFSNGYGDGSFICHIMSELNNPSNAHFQGSFEIGTKSNAWLLDYDCGGKKIHQFTPGRWFVYSTDGDVYICYCDDHTNLIE